jgi:NAD(P)-dependent dehydrogenase (short-subunit alcohol dehydrogenase family)
VSKSNGLPASSRDLHGKVALVTGASRGLGQAIALELARQGARVAVAARTEAVWDDRRPGTIHETVSMIERAGGQALAVVADMAQEADLDRLVDTARTEFGPVDVLVNNAALTLGGRPPAPGSKPAKPTTVVHQDAPPSLATFPLKALRVHFSVNVFASYRLMQLVLPDMAQRGAGNIVNISSDAAFKPGEGPYPADRAGVPTLFAYGCTKAALHVITQAAAVEFAPHGVAANVLLPSLPIKTPGSVALLEGFTIEQWSTPERFAAAARHLATVTPDEVNGQILFHEDVLHPELGRRGFLTEPL